MFPVFINGQKVRQATSTILGRSYRRDSMSDDKNSNGKNGKSVGLVDRIKSGVREDIESLKTDLPAKAKEQIDSLRKPTKTQLYTSIFRHKHDDTPRNRALGVLSNVFLHLHPAKINRDAVRYSYTWGMGGITFYLFFVLTLTGVLLMFYYHPSKVQAFRDVLYLEHDVPYGKLLRNMHRWAAHLMVIAVELHMFRVFLTGSYKKPREFNWTVGVILLVLTLLLSFTGYLLPDDQLGFWAVTVGTNMARATPLLGHEGPFGPQFGMTPYNDVRFGLLGGSIVDANALLRSYIWHCIGIPIIAMIPLVAFYIYLAGRQAFANDKLIADLSANPALAKTHHRRTWPFRPGWQKEVHVWPFLLRVEFLAAIIVTIILMVWSITLNAPLEEPANPNLTMNPAKAPWYFLGLQEMLVYFDPWIAGVVMPTLIIIGLMVIPYIDTNPLGSGYYTWKQRKFAISTFLFGFVILWVSMIFIGTFIRGPGWQWFWPGQTWDHNRLIYEVNRDLPDLLGITSNLWKGIFGAIVVGGYFVIGGLIVNGLFRRYNPKDYKRMSLLQYSIMMTFFLIMVALPIKILIRLLFHIKYLWITPWFNI